jgi:hypothetical protein
MRDGGVRRGWGWGEGSVYGHFCLAEFKPSAITPPSPLPALAQPCSQRCALHTSCLVMNDHTLLYRTLAPRWITCGCGAGTLCTGRAAHACPSSAPNLQPFFFFRWSPPHFSLTLPWSHLHPHPPPTPALFHSAPPCVHFLFQSRCDRCTQSTTLPTPTRLPLPLLELSQPLQRPTPPPRPPPLPRLAAAGLARYKGGPGTLCSTHTTARLPWMTWTPPPMRTPHGRTFART